MELSLHSGGTLTVSDSVFGAKFNEALVHQAVTTFLAGARAGTKGQKTRSQVRGGGIKPWKQKGTGRARAGTIRSPLWRGGGKVFAAVNRDHSQKINKKMYRGAMRAIWSELLRQGRLVAVEQFVMESAKTKDFIAKMKADFNLDPSSAEVRNVLIITDNLDENLWLASRNLFRVLVLETGDLDPVLLVSADKVIMTAKAIELVNQWLSLENPTSAAA
jgi:large subunit ribosomal protein L4